MTVVQRIKQTPQIAKHGFTVVELLIVIIVIGIIAGIAIPQYNGVMERSRDAERKSDISIIAVQLEYYYGRTGAYPTRANLNTEAFRTANKISFDDQAAVMADPENDSVTTLADTVTPTDTYGYRPLPSGCVSPTTSTGAQNPSGTKCNSFTLSAHLEDVNDEDRDATSTATNAYFIKRNAAN